MTRQVTNLWVMILYSLTIQFLTPPLLARRFFFFFNISWRALHSGTPHFTYHQKLLIFPVFWPPQNPYLPLYLRKLDLLFISAILVPLISSLSLKICRYCSKKLISTPSMNIQSFSLSLSSIANLKKKDFIATICPHHQQIWEKRKFLLQKNSIADLFQQFYKTSSTSGFFGSQVEPACFHCLPGFKIFPVFIITGPDWRPVPGF